LLVFNRGMALALLATVVWMLSGLRQSAI
jgi:hypothetical protein